MPEYFRYDVGFVDVVIFDCSNYQILCNTRLFYLCVLLDSAINSVLCSILFDPGRCYCYWDSIKPCKSNEFRLVAYGSVTRG